MIRVETALIQKTNWGPRTLTYWLALLCALGLVALGVNGLIQPEAASRAFGLGIVDPLDSGFVRVKATRDLVLGLTIALFFILKMKQSLMYLALVSALIPFIDGILVLTQYGGQAVDSLQHFITAIIVLAIAFLLWREEKKPHTMNEASDDSI